MTSLKKHFGTPAVWIPALVALAFVAGLFSAKGLFQFSSQSAEQRKLATILGIIGSEYVDAVDTDSLLRSLYPDLMAGLDPHSVYIPSEDLEAVNGELEGSFSGIGISFNTINDTINVLEVIAGGPSEKVGIMAGDRIVTIDDSIAAGRKWTSEKVMSHLRGEAGSKVKLGIRRRTAPDILTFEVTRGEVPVKSIVASYIIEPGVGYINISKFGRNTYNEFVTSLLDLRDKGAKKFILDLRGNTGGFMDMAIWMANEFLPSHKLIVSTHGRENSVESMSFSDGRGMFPSEELVLLIDEYSASSSEILAGAIQDNDRGLIIGRRSFGKGLVQRQMDLDDGSAMRLTIARYYTPSGRCIQKTYNRGELNDYSHEILDRFTSGELFNLDSIKTNKSLLFRTAAGREVYGGGGILPDIFVPNDTSAITSWYLNAINSGMMQRFAFDYVDANRSRLSKATSVDALLSMLPTDDTLLDDFVEYAAIKGNLPRRWYYINISRNLIVTDIKALIVRDVLGLEGYYQVFNRSDATVKRALDELRSGHAKPPVKVTL